MTLRAGITGAGVALSLCAAMWCGDAHAYRPFDGADAAVADPGKFELEFGPLGFLGEGSQRTLIAPATVLNLGFALGWEAVVEGQVETILSPGPTRSSLVANGAFLKGMLREGSLQGKSGPSIATEFGVLLPGIRGDHGTGASLAGVVSQRWSWLTAHFNAEVALTRDHRADFMLGAIVEGPPDWAVRPVAEIFYERELGALTTVSGLFGLIWQLKDALAFDIGVRRAQVGNEPVHEIRAGLTVGFTVW